MLAVPVAAIVAASAPAFANCAITSGAGTTASPANGAIVTCTTVGGEQTSTVGDGTDGVAATVNLEPGAIINTVAGEAVSIDDATVTLGSGAVINTNSDYDEAVYSYSNANDITSNVTLGDNARVSTQGYYTHALRINAPNNNITRTVTLQGNNSQIVTAGVYARPLNTRSSTGNLTETLILAGEGSSIVTTGNQATGFFIRTYSGDATQVITLSGDSSRIDTNGSAAIAWSYAANTTRQTVTLSGSNTMIRSQNNHGLNAYTHNGPTFQTITLSGRDTQIVSAADNRTAAFAYTWTAGPISQVVTLSGQNAQLATTGNNSITANSYSRGTGNTTQQITLSGAGSNIIATGVGSEAITSNSLGGTSQTNVTLGQNTSVVSSQSAAIVVSGAAGGNPGSSIDSAGLIQGGTNSISLDDGNDSLTLRTGSNLSSPAGADLGAGNDTLTLVGTSSEDETFLNIETLEVNANNAGWTFTTNSTFDDINLNTGLFKNNGTLTVNNILTVDNGATFGGAGTIIGDIVNNGTVAPGNSIGTQTIAGNFSQGAGGVLSIETDGAGNSDLLDITGTATLNGIARFSGSGAGFDTSDTYTFIQTAGGVGGAFSAVEDTMLFVDIGNVMVVGNDVQASVIGTMPVNTAANTSDSSTVANAIDAVASSSGGAEIFGIVNNMPSMQAAQNLLSSQASTVTLNAVNSAGTSMGQVTDVVQGHLASVVAGPSNTNISQNPANLAGIAPAAGGADTHDRHFWVQAVGGVGSVDNDIHGLGADYKTYGVAAGADRTSPDSDIVLGAFGAVSKTSSDVNTLADESDVVSYQAGLYGFKRFDTRWHMNGSMSASWLEFDTQRPVATGVAEADFSGHGVFGRTELLYDMVDDGITYSPYISLEASSVYHQNYSESGAGALDMSVNDNTTTKISSGVGVQIETAAKTTNHIVTPTLKVGWHHEFADNKSEVNSSFSNVPGATFKTQGPELSRNSMRVGFDLSITEPNEISNFYTKYDGVFADDARSHALTTGIKVKW